MATFDKTSIPHAGDSAPSGGNAEPYSFWIQNNNRFGGVLFTISAEATNVVTVTLSLRDVRGRAMDRRVVCDIILSTTSFGEADATPSDVAVTTGTYITESPTDSVFTVQSTAAGLIVITVTKAGAATYFPRVRIGDTMIQAHASNCTSSVTTLVYT
jgi:hypothetical protein